MTTKFAIINPNDGTYNYTTSEEERDKLLSEIAWKFYLEHTHNMPYSIVTIGEDSSETWTTPQGEPRLSPQQLEEVAKQWLASIEE